MLFKALIFVGLFGHFPFFYNYDTHFQCLNVFFALYVK